MYFNNYRTKSQQERLLFSAVSRDSWIICYRGTLQHHEQAADNRPIAISEVDDDDIFIVQLMDDHSPTSTACFWGHRACFSVYFWPPTDVLRLHRTQRTCSYRPRKQRFSCFHDNIWLLPSMTTSPLSDFTTESTPLDLSRTLSALDCHECMINLLANSCFRCESWHPLAFSTCSRTASSPRASRIALKRPQFDPVFVDFYLLWILPTLHRLSLVSR